MMAAAPVAAGAAPAAAAAESTDFQVTLTDAPADKKIGVIKVVREITGLGLKEAKELVEATPKEIKASAPKAEAESIKKKLEEAGAKVTLKGL
jgi:large subunit ribosomal protein L7/L12